MGFLLKLFAGPLIDKILGGVKTVFGDREKKDDQNAVADTKVVDQFASENLQIRENRTWWDSLVDGLNRLPRPLGFFGLIALFAWAVQDPAAFSVAMKALALVPPWLTTLATMVAAFYYAGRWIAKDIKWGGGSTKQQVQEVLELQRQVRGFQPSIEPSPSESHQINDTQSSTKQRLKEDMQSEVPLSLPSIKKWNELHNPNFKK